MKPSYFRQTSTASVKNNAPISLSSSLETMRGKILSPILFIFLIIGLVTFIDSLSARIQQKDWGIIIGYAIGLGWMVIVTFIRRLGYRLRATSLVLAVALLGTVSLLSDGLSGSGRIFLFAVPIVTGLVFGAKSSIVALILTLVIYVVVGFLLGMRFLPGFFLQSEVESTNMGAYLMAGANLALVCSAITIVLAMILRRLQASFEKEKHLVEELDIERARQEHRALQHTQELERQLKQLSAAVDITRTIDLYHQQEKLLPEVMDLIKERLDFYFTGIYILDDQNEFAVLQAGTGEAGASMKEAGHRVAVDETTSVGWAIQHQQARIAVDVGFEAVRFDNPLLPLTRSELALPLLVSRKDTYQLVGDQKSRSGFPSSAQGEQWVLGAITIQSTQAKAFDQEDITILQGIADALATTLDHLSKLQQLEQNLEETQALHRKYLLEAWQDFTRDEENRQFLTGKKQPTSLDQVKVPNGSEFRFPIKLRDQEIGQLTFDLDKEELTDEEIALIQAVTTQTATALENVRLLEKNQRQAGYDRLLSDISRKVSSSTDLDTILRITIKELGQALGATDGLIRLEIPAGEEEVQL